MRQLELEFQLSKQITQNKACISFVCSSQLYLTSHNRSKVSKEFLSRSIKYCPYIYAHSPTRHTFLLNFRLKNIGLLAFNKKLSQIVIVFVGKNASWYKVETTIRHWTFVMDRNCFILSLEKNCLSSSSFKLVNQAVSLSIQK